MHRLLTGPLRVETVTVEILGLLDHLQNTRIVQLSDFHYDGRRLSDWLLEEAIAASNEQFPDAVMLTGDFVTDDPTPIHDLALRLKRLQSRCGVYAVLGNHDHYEPGADVEITAALMEVGIKVLWNEIAYPFGEGLPVVGLADLWSWQFNPAKVMNQLDPATPRIVLSHQPDSAAVLQRWRVDLQLSGHTHGGQVVLPGLGPLPAWGRKLRGRIPRAVRRHIPYFRRECYNVIRHWKWAQGLHSVGSNALYVNRGLGTYWPGRLWCPPEVTVITLVRAEDRR
jgi:uncharacterized protein